MSASINIDQLKRERKSIVRKGYLTSKDHYIPGSLLLHT